MTFHRRCSSIVKSPTPFGGEQLMTSLSACPEQLVVGIVVVSPGRIEPEKSRRTFEQLCE